MRLTSSICRCQQTPSLLCLPCSLGDHGAGDNGTVTAQGTQDEDKYTTQVEDPELDAAETATIQSSATSWGLDRIDQVNLPLNGDYEPGLDGRATHVYVLDTGVRTSHRDFQGRIGEGGYHAAGGPQPTDPALEAQRSAHHHRHTHAQQLVR